jgi:hypothetical protein
MKVFLPSSASSVESAVNAAITNFFRACSDLRARDEKKSAQLRAAGSACRNFTRREKNSADRVRDRVRGATRLVIFHKAGGAGKRSA